jgi:hypothetical protein
VPGIFAPFIPLLFEHTFAYPTRACPRGKPVWPWDCDAELTGAGQFLLAVSLAG